MCSDTYADTAEALMKIVMKLRAPGGCPWDREQTCESLRSTLAEECAEVIDAIELNDSENLCEELGDLLMNVVFQAVLAAEKGEFTWADVCRGINEKMVRRHPHVFGAAQAADVAEVMTLWNAAKAGEKNHAASASVLDRIPASLSALDRATAMQKKAAKIGFDWDNPAAVVAKLDEELAELKSALAAADEAKIDEELGDLLFTAVNLARFRKRESAEALLRAANRKFQRRFQYMETVAATRNFELSCADATMLELLWQEAKRATDPR